jgi:hypothetical protein
MKKNIIVKHNFETLYTIDFSSTCLLIARRNSIKKKDIDIFLMEKNNEFSSHFYNDDYFFIRELPIYFVDDIDFSKFNWEKSCKMLSGQFDF